MRAGARTLVVAGALVASLAAPAGAQAAVTCTVTGGTLRVTSPRYGETMRVGRVGDQITVVGYDYVDAPFVPSGEPVPKTCGGPTPTVSTIDSIQVSAVPRDTANLIVDLAGGALAPGATAEPDGSSEIELSLAHVDDVVVRGGDGAESLAFGVVGPDAGVNFNAGEATPDVDLLVPPTPGRKRAHGANITVAAGGGDDQVTANGGPGFTGPAPYEFSATGQDGNDRILGGDRGGALVGGAGNDVVIGGRKPDFLGGGKGAGRDTLLAGKGNDLIFAQGGRDLIFGGAGVDLIASGEGRDRVRCGPQTDALEITTGRKDRRKGCELLISFEGLFN